MDVYGQATTGSINPGGAALPPPLDLESGPGHAIEGAADAVNPLVEQAATRAHHAVDAMARAVSRAAVALDEKRRKLGGMQSEFTERCCDEVRARPLAAVGVAAGVGFLLGVLLSRP